MRRIRYSVATSLDGFIAGPQGQFDWINIDPDIDFQAFYSEFDTILMGRRSFEVAGGGAWNGMQTIVASRTLRQEDHPKVTIVTDVKRALTNLCKEPGKDIWLFGGGRLFRSLLDLGLVNTVEVAVIPVLLGEGIPLLAPPFTESKLKLKSHRVYKTGIVALEYGLQSPATPASSKAKLVTGKRKSNR